MPVDPRSDLPFRLARVCAKHLEPGAKVTPSGFYTHDGNPPGIWHSTADASEATASRYSNRRMTCFNLVQTAPTNAEGTEFQTGLDFQKNKGIVVARCAIHEVIDGWQLNLEGQDISLSNIPPTEGQIRKIGVELTLDTGTPQTLKRNRDGTISILPDSVGQSYSWDNPAHYDPNKHGRYLENFADDYFEVNLVWIPRQALLQTPGLT